MTAAEALPRDFYRQPAVELAPALLGKLLVHETEQGLAAGMITETEAYAGPEDDAAHSYGGRVPARTAVQYGPEGKPEVGLGRALEPVQGLELMRLRRKTDKTELLCAGPGRLCQALGITKAQYGLDLCAGPLLLRPYQEIPAGQVALSPRVNIDYAPLYRDRLWRFFIAGSRYVSKVPKRYAQAASLEQL